MQRIESLSTRCRRQKINLENINTILHDWNSGHLCVVIGDETSVSSNVPTVSLNEMIGRIRNFALAGLGEYELVLGIPEQTYPIRFGEALDYEEPEGY